MHFAFPTCYVNSIHLPWLHRLPYFTGLNTNEQQCMCVCVFVDLWPCDPMFASKLNDHFHVGANKEEKTAQRTNDKNQSFMHFLLLHYKGNRADKCRCRRSFRVGVVVSRGQVWRCSLCQKIRCHRVTSRKRIDFKWIPFSEAIEALKLDLKGTLSTPFLNVIQKRLMVIQKFHL